MDPFAPDSDPEEDADHPLSASQRTGRHSRVSSRSSNHDAALVPPISDAILEDDDEGPPPSILLASSNKQPAVTTKVEISDLTPNGHQSRHAEAGPSRISESVRLGSINIAGNAASLYEDNEQDGSEGDEADELRDMEEEIGLLNEPRQSSASSSSSSRGKRGKKDRGLFQSLARKVRKRAAKVQAENSMLGGTSGRKAGASGLNPRERALWEWGTRENMDEFLQEVRLIGMLKKETSELTGATGIRILCGQGIVLHSPDKGAQSAVSMSRLCLLNDSTHALFLQNNRLCHWLFNVSRWMRRLYKDTA
jgi:hypothetical protein